MRETPIFNSYHLAVSTEICHDPTRVELLFTQPHNVEAPGGMRSLSSLAVFGLI